MKYLQSKNTIQLTEGLENILHTQLNNQMTEFMLGYYYVEMVVLLKRTIKWQVYTPLIRHV